MPPRRFDRFTSKRFILACLGSVCCLCWTLSSPAAAADPAVDFTRDVRPILSNRCFACHGPDAAERESGLRLDTATGILAPADSGKPAIVPGSAAQSELIRRVSIHEADERMPPPEFGKPLEPREIELLKRWIDQGANFVGHWAYQPLATNRPPEVPQGVAAFKAWRQHPVDRFLAVKMHEHGLKPNPRADRATLIRRVTLDLTGLPPSPEEVQAFVKDTRPNAYTRLVDRLLASPAYGEHWARQWLDLARYADSAGYADDPPRTIWGYRDWVIRALNDNQPFDEFTLHQIAGDLLPNPSDDQLIATAFHRNTLTNNEGGTNDEEFRNVAVVDRVNTTLAVWMGTTMACAQCHSHKYDPVSQEDYFRVFAIFNQSEDADRRDESPLLEYFTDQQKSLRKQLESERQSLRTVLSTDTPALQQEQAEWEQQAVKPGNWTALTLQSASAKDGTKLTLVEEPGVVAASEPAKQDTYELTSTLEPGEPVVSLRLESLPQAELPGGGSGFGGGNFVITRITVAVVPEAADAKTIPIKIAAAGADYSQDGFSAAEVLDEKDTDKTGWAVAGGAQQPHQLTLKLAEPLQVAAPTKLRIVIEQRSKYEQHLLGRFRLQFSRDPQSLVTLGIPGKLLAALHKTAPERSTDEAQNLAEYFRLNVAASLGAQRTRLAEVDQQLKSLQPITTIPVMRDLATDKQRVTKIQRRGNFMDLGDEVHSGVPQALNPTSSVTEVRNRLDLARWLLEPSNPLTPRVVANRYWESLFGQGLVRTSEEFGSQGELPSHPELLDWLAKSLQDHQWDTKAFLRMLVTSSAYQQSSAVSDEAYESDSANVWLARGPRFRMSAEMVRDQALAVSNLLSRNVGGAPVRPPQPNLGVNAAFGSAVDWQTSPGADRFRRGLYTTWRRSNPYPSMITFDAPNREVCTLKRDRTNTPLQALVTLNDPVYLDAARALSVQLTALPTREDRIRELFRRCLARAPKPEEMESLKRLESDLLKSFAEKPTSAEELLKEMPVPPGDRTHTDLAAWTIIANVVLNLDEMIMRR